MASITADRKTDGHWFLGAVSRAVMSLAVTGLLAGSATAQGPTPVESITVPPPDAIVGGAGTQGSGTRIIEGMSGGVVHDGGIVYEGDLAPIDMSHDYSLELDERHIRDDLPALTESSETWLKRGWWYTRVDAVVLQRRWDRNDIFLASDPQVGIGNVLVGPTLRLGRSAPGREGSLRLTLGRFLFRDKDNRDHTTEFTYFGGGEFGQNDSLIALDATGIAVSAGIDLGGALSFDGASRTEVDYDNRFNSFEWNYVVTSRGRQDRMELQPNGEWVRRLNEGTTYHGSFGLRYMQVDENLNWTAAEPTTSGAGSTGTYTVDTDNNMFGPQAGGGITQQWDRASITFSGQVGILANFITSNESVTFVDGTGTVTDDSFFERDQEDTMPFIMQFGINGRWQMRPNVALRAGYEMMFVTAIALAPHQVNFQEFDGDIAATGDSFYHGISLGFEGYW